MFENCKNFKIFKFEIPPKIQFSTFLHFVFWKFTTECLFIECRKQNDKIMFHFLRIRDFADIRGKNRELCANGPYDRNLDHGFGFRTKNWFRIHFQICWKQNHLFLLSSVIWPSWHPPNTMWMQTSGRAQLCTPCHHDITLIPFQVLYTYQQCSSARRWLLQ